MGNENGNEYELWPSRYLRPCEQYHRQYHSTAQQDCQESRDAIHRRLGQLALVNRIRAAKLTGLLS